MEKQRILYLLEGWTAQRLSAAELQELTVFLADETNRNLFVGVGADLFAASSEQPEFNENLLPLLQKTLAIDRSNGSDYSLSPYLEPAHSLPARSGHDIHPLRRWAWAAACLLLIGAGAWFFYQHHHSPVPMPLAKVHPTDIAPGKQGAILTLADGRQLELDSAANGTIATQAGARLLLHNGQLTYKDSITRNPTAATGGQFLAFNTMTTPRGRQFRLVLPDGSKVWLNAASSITYPTAFSGHERTVTISGEAYFEIARNTALPFFVRFALSGRKDTGSVAVLGTSFDINAYTDEKDIRTTLTEGSIRVSGGPAATTTLRPGEQASIGSSSIRVRTVDPEVILAWKDGLFNFEGLSLQEVMRQLARWYDIDLVYTPSVPSIQFFGSLSRNTSLSGMLDGLERSGLHFTLEGRKLTILP